MMMRSKELFLGLIGVLLIAVGITNGGDILLHWRLDETSGTIVNDTASIYDGTMAGTPTWMPTEPNSMNGAIRINAEPLAADRVDKILSNTAVDFGAGTSVSVSVWAKPTTAQVWWSRVMMTDNYTTGFYLGFNDAGYWGFLIRGVGNFSPTPYIMNAWQHVVGTYDGTTIKIYVNGVLKNSKTQAGLTIANQKVRLGTERNDQRFEGLVDDAVVFNRALSADEIQTIYNNGLAGKSVDSYRAQNPSPADGSTNQPVGASLSFTAGSNPPAPIANHILYYGTSAMDVSKSTENFPNGTTMVVSLPAGTTSYMPPSGLTSNATYYWRVDEKISNPDVEGITDPNTARGEIWHFATVQLFPIFTNQPSTTYTSLGETASFTADATVGDISYQWYYDADKTPGGEAMLSNGDRGGRISGANTHQLAISSTIAGDAGYYFCRAINADGSTDSQYAELVVKKLVAQWKMDGNLLDTSDSGYHATSSNPSFPVGADYFETGIDGQGLYVATDDENINAGNVLGFERDQPFSISLWVKGSPGGNEKNDALVGKMVLDAPFTGYEVHVNDLNSGGAIAFWLINSAWTNSISVRSEVGVLDDAWHHVVVTYDGSSMASGANIYIDGPSNRGKTVLADNLTGSIVNTNKFEIGSRGEAAGFQFDGMLDDIRVYNYQLSATEVANLTVDFAGPVCTAIPENDLNRDCVINLMDLGLLASDWLNCNWFPTCVSVLP